MEEKYSWLGTVSAPQEYPMEVYSGAIIANDFTYGFDAIWGTQNTGWGETGGVMSVSTEQMEIPHSLEFTWYSLVENKFYTGKWKLDKAKITSLFNEGFKSYHSGEYVKKTYSNFIVGLAPEGRVVLWIMGEGNQKEVGVFKAHDTLITKEQAYENARYMFEKNYAADMLNDPEYKTFTTDTRQKIETKGYPATNIYDIYRNRYKWKPNIILPKGYKTTNVFIRTCNGEGEKIISSIGEEIETKDRAIPSRLSIGIANENGGKNGAEIIFTEDKDYWKNYIQQGTNSLPLDFSFNEINKAFEENINLKEPSELIIKINPKTKEIEVYLQQKDKVIALKNNLKIVF